jgi:predicted transcriptional regulator
MKGGEYSMMTKMLVARVPALLVEKVDQLATRTERSKGWIIRKALAAFIEHEEEHAQE